MSTVNLTLLFADICNSTQLYEQLGDVRAKQRVSECLESIRIVALANAGTVVKSIGDELLIRFDKPDHAFRAAITMQNTSGTARGEDVSQQKSLDLRVAFHSGLTIMENNDVFGDTVNTAARIVALTKPGQILTSRETIDTLSSAYLAKCRHIDSAALKGKADKLDIYEVFDQEDDLTQMTEGVIQRKNQIFTLVMRYQQKEFIFRNDRVQFTIGRGPQCDMVINETLASRQHLTVENRMGKFVIVDQSTNGTWVRDEEGEELFLRREEMFLPPSGDMSFGRSFSENRDQLLHFRIAEG